MLADTATGKIKPKKPPLFARLFSGSWDKQTPWRPFNMPAPKIEGIAAFYGDANCGVHPVESILPAPAWPPMAPEGAQTYGHESQQPGPFIVVNRAADTALVAPGPRFFRDMMNSALLHV